VHGPAAVGGRAPGFLLRAVQLVWLRPRQPRLLRFRGRLGGARPRLAHR